MARLGFGVRGNNETSGAFNDHTHRSNCHHRKKNDPDLVVIHTAGSPADGDLDQAEKPLG